MSDEKFCLKWNDFDLNLKSSFRDLRDSKDLFDMTLVCGEFHQVQAHKVILSASSPFFRDVLASNPHVNPLIYLRGISQTDLQYILDFIYHGEVSVSQSNLNNFLSVAEDLKIKGLTQSQTDPKASSKSEPKHRRPPTHQQPQRSRQSLGPTEDEVEIEEVPVRVKNEAADNTIQDHTVALDQDYGHGAYSGGDLMEGDYGGDEVYEDPGLQLQDYAGATDKGELGPEFSYFLSCSPLYRPWEN